MEQYFQENEEKNMWSVILYSVKGLFKNQY